MEAALVSAGTGAMKPLLSKFSKLLEEEYSKLKGVRRKIKDTKDEMHSMEAALEVLSDAEQLDPATRAWRDDVRELSYDMEDCVDDFRARVDHDCDESSGRMKRFFHKLKNLKPRHEIADEIEELRARAIEASKRHNRYKLENPAFESITTDIDPRLHALYVDVNKLVGINGPKEEIIEWIKNEGSSTQLRVVSIVGPGGLGKTTLANAIFETFKGEFRCASFVSVSRKPNMKNVLRDIAERVGISDHSSNDDERQLIDRLRKHLRDKKYLIVIDDIWSTEAWKTIRDALLSNENGSRIITTTRNSTVASFCSSQGDYVYRMRPLNSADSRRLFLERAFSSEDLCPPHLKVVSEKIMEKCAGLPLAIITMSSLLADQTAEEVWHRALAAIGSSLAKERDAGDMTKILSLSYFDLPIPMRTCLLYLSAFPEDYIICKRSLIHKWIAEGFIREEHGRTAFEVGEDYFNDFINRSLTQPANLLYGQEGYDEHKYGLVGACRVHDIILDFISCKAKEENFMTSSGDVADHGKKHKVRRLSVVNSCNYGRRMSTVSGDLSHTRSLAIFGHLSENTTILDFPSLRVLDTGPYWCLENEDLVNFEKLLLLKYLRLGCNPGRYIELPGDIGKLKYLETLDMRDVIIRKLPLSMTRLQRLSRLYASFEPDCLSDGIIGQIQSLEELEDVHVFGFELDKFLEELGQLTKLRTLSVTVRCLTYRQKMDILRLLGTLISSYNLHQVTICCSTNTDDILSLEPWCPPNPASFRKICIDRYHIDKVPNWMISLVNLRVLDIRMYRLGPEDVVILGAIPALFSLKLATYHGRNGKIFIRGFRSLKYFNLQIWKCGTAVKFEEGSMPRLEHLKVQFWAHTMKCLNYASDIGIQHLSSLTKVDVNINGQDHTMNKLVSLIKTALGKLGSRPTHSFHLSGNSCDHFEKSLEKMFKEEAGSSEQHIREGALCSHLDHILEEIRQDGVEERPRPQHRRFRPQPRGVAMPESAATIHPPNGIPSEAAGEMQVNGTPTSSSVAAEVPVNGSDTRDAHFVYVIRTEEAKRRRRHALWHAEQQCINAFYIHGHDPRAWPPAM